MIDLNELSRMVEGLSDTETPDYEKLTGVFATFDQKDLNDPDYREFLKNIVRKGMYPFIDFLANKQFIDCEFASELLRIQSSSIAGGAFCRMRLQQYYNENIEKFIINKLNGMSEVEVLGAEQIGKYLDIIVNNNYIDTFKEMMRIKPVIVNNPAFIPAFNNSMTKGNIDILIEMLRILPSYQIKTDEYKDEFKSCCTKGMVKVAEAMIDASMRVGFDIINDGVFIESLDAAVNNNRLDVLKKLIDRAEHYNLYASKQNELSIIFSEALQKNNPSTVAVLMKAYPQLINDRGLIVLFQKLAYKNHHEVISSILDNLPENEKHLILTSEHIQSCFYTAGHNKKFQLMESMLNSAPSLVNTPAFDRVLYNAIVRDRADVILNMIRFDMPGFSVDKLIDSEGEIDQYELFKYGIVSGRTEVINAILSDNPSLNISRLKNEIFGAIQQIRDVREGDNDMQRFRLKGQREILAKILGLAAKSYDSENLLNIMFCKPKKEILFGFAAKTPNIDSLPPVPPNLKAAAGGGAELTNEENLLPPLAPSCIISASQNSKIPANMPLDIAYNVSSFLGSVRFTKEEILTAFREAELKSDNASSLRKTIIPENNLFGHVVEYERTFPGEYTDVILQMLSSKSLSIKEEKIIDALKTLQQSSRVHPKIVGAIENYAKERGYNDPETVKGISNIRGRIAVENTSKLGKIGPTI